jgi:HPt (histidine-containing phosphotransfer) domain-containing protein
MPMDPVNLKRMREASMDDEEFMRELIDIYLEDMPTQLEALRAAVEKRDATSAAATAHRLRGSSGNVGADALSSLCREIERSSRDNQLDQLPGLVEAVGLESDRVRQFLVSVRQGAQEG